MTVGPLVVQQVEVAVLPTYGNMGSWFRMETGQSKLHKVKGNIKYKYELNLEIIACFIIVFRTHGQTLTHELCIG